MYQMMIEMNEKLMMDAIDRNDKVAIRYYADRIKALINYQEVK